MYKMVGRVAAEIPTVWQFYKRQKCHRLANIKVILRWRNFCHTSFVLSQMQGVTTNHTRQQSAVVVLVHVFDVLKYLARAWWHMP